jgi:hypothetical protein
LKKKTKVFSKKKKVLNNKIFLKIKQNLFIYKVIKLTSNPPLQLKINQFIN